MITALTPNVARDVGRTLRFLRHARNLTISDVAKTSGVSMGYVQNIEAGLRRHADDTTYYKIGRGLGVPEEFVHDLLFRAQVMTAFERREVPAEAAAFVWRGVEQRLEEQGIPLRTNLEKVIADMLVPR